MIAFVDSAAWVAVVFSRDARHRSALDFFRSAPRRTRWLTTNYVVAETLTWLASRRQRRAATQWYSMLTSSVQQGILDLFWITPDVHQQAWEIFQRYEDKNFSFFDCTSFVVARQEAVDFVFGFDEDFRVMGFDVRPGP